MTRNACWTWTLVLLVAFSLVATAQDPKKDPSAITVDEDGDYVMIHIQKEGVEFEEFVNLVADVTKKQFVIDHKKTQNQRIKLIGKKLVHKDSLFQFFQTLFITQGYAIVTLGPPGAEINFVEDIRTSTMLKQRARFVDHTDLETHSRFAGEIIATTIPLKFISVDKAQRALNNIASDHKVGFVVPVEESNSLLVTNFAPTVWMIYQIIQKMDVEMAENQLAFEKLSLEYHLAEDLAEIVQELIDVRAEIRSSGGRAPSSSRSRTSTGESRTAPPAPKIRADSRTNSLLVYAVEEYMDEIKMLVASLDTEVTEPSSNIHIYELKNTNAEDVQQVLMELVNQGNTRGTRATGAGGTRSSSRNRTSGNTGRPTGNTGNTGNRGAFGSSNDDFINIVADANTNSLLVNATRTQYEEIAAIVKKLDRRRPQVLVQAAIVELSDTDLQNIGVELAQVEGGGDEARFFGASSFGMSTIDTQTNLNGTTGTGGTGTGTGGGTGGTTTSSGNFFDDLVRVPNLSAQGLVGGIFTNFVEVPLLVQLFKTVVKGNLVSVPSILVNDNHEAHMTVGTEIPTSTVTQGQFSDQTSFGGYEEANLELRISPHISNDNYLRLEIMLTVSAFTGAAANASIPPPRTTREFETNITMRSGKTVVIGGLTTDNQRETIAGIPFLSDLPIVGALFRNTGTDHEKTTLYVFITPTILSEFEALERISYERKLEISKLDGQINIVDPNFRPLDLGDEAVSIEDIESTGYLDMPRYHPSQPLEEKTNDGDSVPVKPGNTGPKAETGTEEKSSSKAPTKK